jgi:hypothetical protein
MANIPIKQYSIKNNCDLKYNEIINNMCFSNCPMGMEPDPQNISKCIYKTEKPILSCKEGEREINGLCYKSCPEGTIEYDKDNTKCIIKDYTYVIKQNYPVTKENTEEVLEYYCNSLTGSDPKYKPYRDESAFWDSKMACQGTTISRVPAQQRNIIKCKNGGVFYPGEGFFKKIDYDYGRCIIGDCKIKDGFENEGIIEEDPENNMQCRYKRIIPREKTIKEETCLNNYKNIFGKCFKDCPIGFDLSENKCVPNKTYEKKRLDSVTNFKCEEGYQIEPKDTIKGRCLKICPPNTSTYLRDITKCIDNNFTYKFSAEFIKDPINGKCDENYILKTLDIERDGIPVKIEYCELENKCPNGSEITESNNPNNPRCKFPKKLYDRESIQLESSIQPKWNYDLGKFMCSRGSFLNNGCYDECPEGFFGSNDSIYCSKLDDYLEREVKPIINFCEDGKIKIGDKCYDDCPTGYFIDVSNNKINCKKINTFDPITCKNGEIIDPISLQKCILDGNEETKDIKIENFDVLGEKKAISFSFGETNNITKLKKIREKNLNMFIFIIVILLILFITYFFN